MHVAAADDFGERRGSVADARADDQCLVARLGIQREQQAGDQLGRKAPRSGAGTVAFGLGKLVVRDRLEGSDDVGPQGSVEAVLQALDHIRPEGFTIHCRKSGVDGL